VTGEIAHSQLYRGTRGLVTDSQWESRVTGDANARFFVRTDGRHHWGPGTTAFDTILYRNAVGELKTDTNFTVGGNLAANNIYTGPQDTFTPTWSTTSGAHLPSFGNATINGFFSKVGRMVMFNLKITFGSTTNFGSGATSTDNWTFSLPQQAARTSEIIGWYAARPASSNSSMGHLSTLSGDATVVQLNMDGGQPNAVALNNPGVVDSVSPFTWASGDVLVMQGFYEANT